MNHVALPVQISSVTHLACQGQVQETPLLAGVANDF